MTRSALFLAALASAAMPGLDPTSVQRVRPSPDDLFDVAYLEDTQERRWVVKAPAHTARSDAIRPTHTRRRGNPIGLP